jgi:hypothetical protein
MIGNGQVNVWENRVKFLKEEGRIGLRRVLESTVCTSVQFISVFRMAVGSRVDEFGFKMSVFGRRVPVSRSVSLVFKAFTIEDWVTIIELFFLRYTPMVIV